MNRHNLEQAIDLAVASLEHLRQVIREVMSERDPIAAHIYHARAIYRRAVENDSKSGRRSELAARTSWQEATRLGYPCTLGEWERLLRASTNAGNSPE
jgi:hypothetical protein